MYVFFTLRYVTACFRHCFPEGLNWLIFCGNNDAQSSEKLVLHAGLRFKAILGPETGRMHCKSLSKYDISVDGFCILFLLFLM